MAHHAAGKAFRVLIVDAHPIVRHGLMRLLEWDPEFEVCAEAADAPEGLRLFTAVRPDLVITDLGLKGGGGLQLIKQIKQVDEDARVLVVSMYDEIFYAEHALRAGAKGYLRKRAAPTEIIAAARQTLGERLHISPQVSDAGTRGATPCPSERTAMQPH